MLAAIGLKARTGRAVLVAVAGDASDSRIIDRTEIRLLPPGAFAPYHAAAALARDEAHESVKRDIARAYGLAATGIGEAVKRIGAAGNSVAACAVLVGPGMPNWSTDEILAVHVRMHQAEGELFREALVAGVRACDLPVTTLAEKAALDDAAKRLGLTRARLDARLASLGKAVGPPWAKDQKEAAAAALVALEHGRR
jgi:hypothetical protein